MMVEPNTDRIIPRRRALLLAGVGLGSLGLAACGGNSSSNGENDGVSVASNNSSSTPAPAGETFKKGDSGGSKAPKGEYRKADTQGPAQNVSKPVKPEGMDVETPDALYKFLNYYMDLRYYAIQTGDIDQLSYYTFIKYEDGMNLAKDAYHTYKDGGWIIGGERRLVEIIKNTLTSPDERYYEVVCRMLTSDMVIVDNRNRTMHTTRYSDLNKKYALIGATYNDANNWVFVGVDFLETAKK